MKIFFGVTLALVLGIATVLFVRDKVISKQTPASEKS
jgi:hypothetical protein